MRYLAAVLIWLVLLAVWGVIGTLIGPGIVMLIIALLVGVTGALLTVTLFVCGFKAAMPWTGLLVTCVSILLAWFGVANAEMTWRTTVFVAVFVAVPSFIANFLIDRFALQESS